MKTRCTVKRDEVKGVAKKSKRKRKSVTHGAYEPVS